MKAYHGERRPGLKNTSEGERLIDTNSCFWYLLPLNTGEQYTIALIC